MRMLFFFILQEAAEVADADADEPEKEEDEAE